MHDEGSQASKVPEQSNKVCSALDPDKGTELELTVYTLTVHDGGVNQGLCAESKMYIDDLRVKGGVILGRGWEVHVFFVSAQRCGCAVAPPGAAYFSADFSLSASAPAFFFFAARARLSRVALLGAFFFLFFSAAAVMAAMSWFGISEGPPPLKLRQDQRTATRSHLAEQLA